MPTLSIQIIRYMNDAQPGWVECELVDIWERTHSFADKVPMFSAADLGSGSNYPKPGVIRCRSIRQWHDDARREIVTIDTELPDHVESTTGATCFDVSPHQLAG